MKMRISIVMTTLGLILVPGAILFSQADDIFGDPIEREFDGLAESDKNSEIPGLGSDDGLLSEPTEDNAGFDAPDERNDGLVGEEVRDFLDPSPLNTRPNLDSGASSGGYGGGDWRNSRRSSFRLDSRSTLAPIYKRILSLKKSLATNESSKRSSITRQLKKEVALYFDEDLKGRRAEIQNLKRKIKEMEDGLDRRERAKEKIIALQLQTFAFEAQGFGLFNPSEPRSGGYDVMMSR